MFSSLIILLNLVVWIRVFEIFSGARVLLKVFHVVVLGNSGFWPTITETANSHEIECEGWNHCTNHRK